MAMIRFFKVGASSVGVNQRGPGCECSAGPRHVRLSIALWLRRFGQQTGEGVTGIPVLVYAIRWIWQLPTKAHDDPEADHVLLREVEDDVPAGVLDDRLVEHLHRDV